MDRQAWWNSLAPEDRARRRAIQAERDAQRQQQQQQIQQAPIQQQPLYQQAPPMQQQQQLHQMPQQNLQQPQQTPQQYLPQQPQQIQQLYLPQPQQTLPYQAWQPQQGQQPQLSYQERMEALFEEATMVVMRLGNQRLQAINDASGRIVDTTRERPGRQISEQANANLEAQPQRPAQPDMPVRTAAMSTTSDSDGLEEDAIGREAGSDRGGSDKNKCWYCGRRGHRRVDCMRWKELQEEKGGPDRKI